MQGQLVYSMCGCHVCLHTCAHAMTWRRPLADWHHAFIGLMLPVNFALVAFELLEADRIHGQVPAPHRADAAAAAAARICA